MSSTDRNAPAPKPRGDKKEEKMSDLPARDAGGKDDKVKGGRAPEKPKIG